MVDQEGPVERAKRLMSSPRGRATLLAEYAEGLFSPGRGPRQDTPMALQAWVDLLGSLGFLEPEAFKGATSAILAFATAGKHGGWWDSAAFAASLQAAASDQTEGEAWAEACRLVGEWSTGGVVRAPLPDGWVRRGPAGEAVPSMSELLAGDHAQQRLARAIQAIGVEAIRQRRPEDEGTLRAQFREALREAARVQVRGAVLAPQAPLEALPGPAAKAPAAIGQGSGLNRIDVAQVLPARRLA